MSPAIIGPLGGAIAIVLVAVAERTQRPARSNVEGWRVLRPSWLQQMTIVGCAAFAALMAGLLLSGGSTRAGAETQNIYLLVLAVAFGLATVYLGWASYGRSIRWKGDELRIRAAFGPERIYHFSEIRSVKKSEALGEYRLKFSGGTTIGISAYLHGAKELVSRAPYRARKTSVN